MDVGKLNRKVSIERLTDTPDGSGGFTRGWIEIARAWVDAMPIAGKEGIAAGTLRASQPWRLEMHYRDLKTEDRIMATWLPDMKMEVQSVADPDGLRRSLVVFATAVPHGAGS